jgi:CheY-like chemotaxis protein
VTAPVLLVENDVICREDIAETLVEHGYKVEEAGNGLDALAKLESADEPPFVILLDLGTPVMDGWEFRAAQLAHPNHRRIPVVLMSGNNDIRTFAKQLGAAGVLRKPFGLDELLNVVSAAKSAAS